MPTVRFTAHLQSKLRQTEHPVSGRTVAEVLEAVFSREPDLRGYLLDDQGAVRHHVVIFVDGVSIRDRKTLSDPIPDQADLYVMQALSGG